MPGNKRNRTLQYLGEFGGAMGAYIGVLFLSKALRDDVTHPVLVPLLSASPMIPVLLLFWVVIRQYGRLDELQQRIMSEALSVSAILTALGTFTWGFLENTGFPPLNIIWVLPIMFSIWGLSAPFIARRFE